MAATTRTSTLRGRSDPSGVTQPSSNTRRNFACTSSGSSATSSRNSTPESAETNAPSRSCRAPVKAPLTWPKSVELAREGLPAKRAQLTGTSGPIARSPRSWIRWATYSLPVPDSPTIRTGSSTSAHLRIVALQQPHGGPAAPEHVGEARPAEDGHALAVRLGVLEPGQLPDDAERRTPSSWYLK